MRMLAAALLIGAFSNAPDSGSAADLIVGQALVVDGNKLEIHGQRVRLFGIDAPEAGQTCEDARGNPFRCGLKAALVLDARIGEGVVTCEPRDVDRDGRRVAICRVFGEDLGAWMVGLGWAVALRTDSTRYVPAEELARQRKSGLWAGKFVAPSDWRKKRQRNG
jgi:endonuclease YncB( thermonuclease family)